MVQIRLPVNAIPIPNFRSGRVCYNLSSHDVTGYRTGDWEDYTSQYDYSTYDDCPDCIATAYVCSTPINSGTVPAYSTYTDQMGFTSRPTVIALGTTVSNGLLVLSKEIPTITPSSLTVAHGFVILPTTNLADCVSFTLTVGSYSVVLNGTVTPEQLTYALNAARIPYIQSGGSITSNDLKTLTFSFEPLEINVSFATFNSSGTVAITPTCSFMPVISYLKWVATYDCANARWSLSSSSSTGPEYPWFDNDPTGYVRVNKQSYLSPDLGILPIPTCYFYWQAMYNCFTSSWSVTLTYVDTTGEVQDWTDWGGYYVKVTTTPAVPAPPAVTPSCYYYWSSYYDCGTSTWSTPNLDFVDTWGFEQPWSVWDYYANCVTTTSSVPDVPTDVPVC